MKYLGKDIQLGDVVAHDRWPGEWTIDSCFGDSVELLGPGRQRTRKRAYPNELRLVRRKAKPPGAKRQRRVPRTHSSDRSVGLALGAHLGVGRVDDEDVAGDETATPDGWFV